MPKFPETFEEFINDWMGGIDEYFHQYDINSSDYLNVDESDPDFFNYFMEEVENKFEPLSNETKNKIEEIFFNGKEYEEYGEFISSHLYELKEMYDELFIKYINKLYLEEQEELFYNWKNEWESWKFPKTIYREITLKAKNIKDIINIEEIGGLGIYWSIDESSAEAHWGDFKGTNIFLLKADIEENSVDWEGTIISNLSPTTGDIENEIRLKSGARLKNVFIKKDKTNKWYPLSGVNIRASK